MNDVDDDASLRGPLDRPQELPAAGPAAWNLPETWNIPDDAAEDLGDPGRPIAALVSFHYLRAAVRRRWRVCILLAFLGVFLGAAFLVATPALPTATTTLRLTHPEQANPSDAVATDIGFLATRTVAERTISGLGLTMSPEDLTGSVEVVPSSSSEILQLTMTAPTDAEAVRRLDRLTTEYLDFRAKQISAQSDIMIKGYNDQIAALQSQVQTLNASIEALVDGDQSATDQLNDAIIERSQVNDKISSLQGAVQDATLRQNAIILASGVIDPPAPLPLGGLRRAALVLVSGLIGGLALGLGLVVLQAILSDRLRLRIEVASALNCSVLVSVRSIAPLSRLVRIIRFLPWVSALDRRRAVDQQRVAHAIEKAVPEPGRRQSLAVVCLGNSREMSFGLVAAAAALQHHGRKPTIVDLTQAGGVTPVLARSPRATDQDRPEVFRPTVIPSLTKGPSHIDSADWEDVALSKGGNGVALILADLDPAVGVDHLTAWTDSVIVVVTAGKSSVELVRTTGDLVRSVGLRLRGAVLLRAARNDVSSGIATPAGDRSSEISAMTVSRDDGVGRDGKP